MAAGAKSQYAHMANLAVDFVRRRPNLFELAKMQPAYGVGSRFARARWEERGAADSFWTVTRMKPRPSGRSGTAWGFLTWKGSKKDGLVKIPSAQTPGIWKVLQSAGDGIQGGPTLEMPSVATDSSGEDTEEKA